MLDSIVLFSLILISVLALWLLHRDGLIREPWLAVLCAFFVAVIMALRVHYFDVETTDYQWFLKAWVDYYRANGGFRAFGTLPPYCNYNVPYLYFLALFSYLPTRDLYLIKLLSMLFDVLLAWGAMKLLGLVTRNRALRLLLFFTVLLWPSVALNSSIWGQCDSIYVCFLILGLWLALDRHPILSLIMMALSLSFKLQAVFVLPICAVLYFCGKYKWQQLFVFPVAYVVSILPGVLLGLPFWDTLSFYLTQTDSIGGGLNYNSPSVFAIFWRIPEQDQAAAALLGIAAAGIYVKNLLALGFENRRQLSDRSILALSLLLAIGIPFLLPHMHDRYFYAADVLSLILAFAMPSLFLAAPLVGFASFLGYYAYLSAYFTEQGAHYLIYMDKGSYALLGALVLSALGLALSLKSRRQESGSRPKKAR